MIKEKFVEVLITNRNKKYYINKGYEIDKDIILVKTTDLNKNSRVKITAICEICESENVLSYGKYLLNFDRHNYYGCKKCSRIKAKTTSNELYGADNYMQTEEGQQRVQNTLIERYGVSNPMQDSVIKAKTQSTLIERYGNTCALMNDEVKNKSIASLIERYGVDHFSKSPLFKNKMHAKWSSFYKNKLLSYGITDFKLKDENLLNIKCDMCNSYYDTSYKLLYQRKVLYNVEPCTVCNPINNSISWAEQEIYDYVSSLVDCEQTNKTILNGKHIDIFCKDKKIGIEYNGIFWHSEKYKDENFHYHKYILSKNKNVKLFNIFENEWINNKDNIKKLLKNYLQNTFNVVNNYTIKKSKIVLKNVFNGVISNNNYVMLNDDIIIGNISFNDDTITYFNFNFDYDPNIIFNIFIKELKLNNYYYLHDNNNIFLTTNFNFIKYEKPDYKYFNLTNKHTLKLYNKNIINLKYNNNSLKILDNNYLKVYDCGYTLYNFNNTFNDEIIQFLNDNDIPFNINTSDNIISFNSKDRIIEICYVDSIKHSLNNIPKDYFYKLSIEAEKNNRFKLWIKDFEWNDNTKKKILKSYILHYAQKTKNKIYARNCDVVIIDNKTARQFEKNNCFYGSRGASLNLGLVLKRDQQGLKKGDLVMLYTFGNNVFSNDEFIEVIRVGTLLNYHVVGGSSKLFKHFLTYPTIKIGSKNVSTNKIKFYSDYDHNIGSSMEQLGFTFLNYSGGGVMNYHLDTNKIKHREPNNHKQIQEKIKNGYCLAIPNAGVKTFIFEK